MKRQILHANCGVQKHAMPRFATRLLQHLNSSSFLTLAHSTCIDCLIDRNKNFKKTSILFLAQSLHNLTKLSEYQRPAVKAVLSHIVVSFVESCDRKQR